MALGSVPETKATSGKNSDLFLWDQNLQTDEATQARVSKFWFAQDSSVYACFLA